ncbi:hypothetical protein X943_003552 [Babesia divergens]|uniref:Uncharacterized protein n=1 Tax=Babesia divergens TaxID=32595 RepID=A0AAD9GIH5_BABDI|nr:hypothetical protein X943_003552 [Babesia divergens]
MAASSAVPRASVENSRSERMYPLVLCICRVVLAVTQFSVAYDTYLSFADLSVLNENSFDTPLSSIADTKTLYEWVPVMPSGDSIVKNYGKNQLFNYFIIRVIHFLHGNITSLLIYPASITLAFMVILSLYDLFEIYQTRYSKAKLQETGYWLHLVLFTASIALIILQAVILLFESGGISHMEVLYPFLFAYNSGQNSHKMLLKIGAGSLKRGLVASVIFNLGSLVPDTYLLLVKTLQPLRLYIIVNSMKIACGMTVVAAFIMGCIVRYYVGAGVDPKLMGDKTTLNIWKHNQLINVNDIYPTTQWTLDNNISNSAYIEADYTHLPVLDLPKYITSRVNRTTKHFTRIQGAGLEVPEFFARMEDTEDKMRPLIRAKSINVYSFVQNSFGHALHVLKVFLYVVSFVGLSSLSFGSFSFLLVLRRHKLLLYINVLVDAFAVVVHLCNMIMVRYPMEGSEFFCNIKEYIPAGSGATFEAMAIYAWMCRASQLFKLVHGIAAVLALLSIGNIGVLYMLWK